MSDKVTMRKGKQPKHDHQATAVAYTYKVRKVRTHPLSGKYIIFCT